MTTYEEEEKQETEAARCDLVRLLEEIERERGTYSAERAARSLLMATEQGRVVGSSYGFYDEEDDGKVFACILGHIDIALDGMERMGHVPQWAFYNTDDRARRVGRTIEQYACGMGKGAVPATNGHACNVAHWLRTYLF